MAQDWWTDHREAVWECIDEATTAVSLSYESEQRLVGGLSIHCSAPNPYGISADISPDEWYVTLPYEMGRVDVEAIASLLSEELGVDVTIRRRSDEWEPGAWLIIENAEQSLGAGMDRGDGIETDGGREISSGGMGRVERRGVFTCVECDDFELEKKFGGIAGTDGENEYSRIQAPDQCPACGGNIDRSVDTDMNQDGDGR